MKQHENEKLYWEEYWKKENRKEEKFLFSDILKQCNIKINNYFEFGCAPGSIMSYINKEYNSKVSGLDLIDKKIIEEYLKKYNITNYQIFEGDINNFKTDKKYDFVGSYGLIEHFENPEQIIEKHKEVVDEDGYLCITVPNMRYFNYLFNYIFSRKLLETHNLSIMDLRLLKKLIIDNDFEEIYASYYLTSMFQANKDSQRLKEHPYLSKIYNVINNIMERLNLENISNKFASPYIVVIAKRKNKQKIIDCKEK